MAWSAPSSTRRDTGVYMDQRLCAAMNRANKANVLLVRTVDAGAAAVAQTDLDLKQFLEDSNLPVEVGGIFDVTTVNEIAAHRLRPQHHHPLAEHHGRGGRRGGQRRPERDAVTQRDGAGARDRRHPRAIGASLAADHGHVRGRGLIQGILSWLVAIPFGVAGAYVMAVVVLSRILGDELLYVFRPTGVLAWLLVVVVLGIAASWLPARRATRVSVRESLAYQ
ncbi:MAG: ABC transporter permease [Caldilineaceae bacterium]